MYRYQKEDTNRKKKFIFSLDPTAVKGLNLRWQKYILGNFFKTWWVSNGWMIGQVTVTCFNLKFDWILIWSLVPFGRGGSIRMTYNSDQEFGTLFSWYLLPQVFHEGLSPQVCPAQWHLDFQTNTQSVYRQYWYVWIYIYNKSYIAVLTAESTQKPF